MTQADNSNIGKEAFSETPGPTAQPMKIDTGASQAKRSFLKSPLAAVATIVLVSTLGVGSYFTWLRYFHPYETTDDAFVDARAFAVAAKVPGFIQNVNVTDNQHLEAGDTIARIDPRDYQIALDQADGQIQAAQASIANADAQIEVADASIAEMQAQQASSKAALDFAVENATRQRELADGGAGTVQTLQQSTSTLTQAKASYAQATASVTSAIKSRSAAEAQRASALAALKQAQAQKESSQRNLEYTVLKAEQPGRIVQISGSRGEFVEAGQGIATFVPDEMWVTANFKETQLAHIRPGQTVDATIDAYPDHVLHGTVASVQPGSGTAFSLLPAENATGNYVKVTQRVPVKITIDHWPQDVAIGPGMSVVPTVTVAPEQ